MPLKLVVNNICSHFIFNPYIKEHNILRFFHPCVKDATTLCGMNPSTCIVNEDERDFVRRLRITDVRT